MTTSKLDSIAVENILLKGNYITPEDSVEAHSYIDKYKTDLLDYYLSQNILTNDLIGQAIAEHYKIPYADINTNIPSKETVLLLSEDLARKYHAIPYKSDDDHIWITTDHADPGFVLEKLSAEFKHKKLKIAYSMGADIDKLLIYYRDPIANRVKRELAKNKPDLEALTLDIINDAVMMNASDIHFEPQTNEVQVRYRIDGVLQEAVKLDKDHYNNVINLIKVNSAMRIDEHYAAQDGAMQIQKGDQQIDLRISILPTLEGEKVVIRILSQYINKLNFADLGMSEADQKLFLEIAHKPYGMILVTGPTGSGKTSTLYSLIQVLNSPEVNITTIEDPVEYKIRGVNHIQVNKQTDLTFAKGLRSIVRQDPDIILVGEIRDRDTAEIAVNAALTGHLLLSTFHANDSSTAIPRLLDMGIEPFLLASTLELIIAQRLVRKLCESCRISKKYTHKEIHEKYSEIDSYFASGEVSLYESKGCSSCNNTGYKGRTAVYEFIRVTPELKDLVLKNPSNQEIWRIATAQGAKSMFDHGLEKVHLGVTSLNELLRVVAPTNQSALSQSKSSAQK